MPPFVDSPFLLYSLMSLPQAVSRATSSQQIFCARHAGADRSHPLAPVWGLSRGSQDPALFGFRRVFSVTVLFYFPVSSAGRITREELIAYLLCATRGARRQLPASERADSKAKASILRDVDLSLTSLSPHTSHHPRRAHGLPALRNTRGQTATTH